MEHLRRQGLRLEYLTIAWNAGEVVLTIALGVAAGSLALVAFGLDAVIEIFASSVIVAHLRQKDPSPERMASTHRRIAAAFFALAGMLGLGAAASLVARHEPGESLIGVVYLAVTALVMLGLALAKRRVALALGDAPLAAEAGVTFLDAALAAAVLAALALNLAAGWWWADALATLCVAAVAVREGFESLEEAREQAKSAA